MQNYYNHVEIQTRKYIAKWHDSIKTFAPKQYFNILPNSNQAIDCYTGKSIKKLLSTELNYKDYAKINLESSIVLIFSNHLRIWKWYVKIHSTKTMEIKSIVYIILLIFYSIIGKFFSFLLPCSNGICRYSS